MSDDKIKVLTRKTTKDLVNELEAEEPGCTGTIEIRPPSNELQQIPFSSIKRQPIQWLWHKRIARGMVTIFAGEPGKGKSQLLLWLASACSTGGKMPVDGAVLPQGKVAILSAEDDEDVTISPRLYALNANQELILQLKSAPRYTDKGKLTDGTIVIGEDIQRLDNTFANNPGYVCLIIDPITAYLGNINDHKNAEVRGLITKLTGLAKKHNIAVILNTHLNKPGNANNTTSAMNRVSGSIAYVAAARAAYLICDNEDDKKIKQFIPMKNNVGDDETGFEYRIKGIILDDNIETSRIEWLPNSIQKDANDAINSGNRRPASKKSLAIEFLKDQLKNGTKLVNDIRQAAKEQGLAWGTVFNASREMELIIDYASSTPRLLNWTLPARYL